MEVIRQKEGKALTVTLKGRLNANTAPLLEKELFPDLDDVYDLRFDFSQLEYLSSAGLRLLLIWFKAMVDKGGSLRVLHPRPEVMEILEMTGFVMFLPIEA